MLDADILTRRTWQGIGVGAGVTVFLACCFAVAMIVVSHEQASRQRATEGASQIALTKSVHAASKTEALSVEQERIRSLAIKNCDRLRDYVSTAAETRNESAANAVRFNANSSALAIAFAQFPDGKELSQLFAKRAVLDLQRAHIARLAQKSFGPIMKISCSLDLPTGR